VEKESEVKEAKRNKEGRTEVQDGRKGVTEEKDGGEVKEGRKDEST
jgi:hypothetical protein